MADDRNHPAGLSAFRDSKTRYLIAAALGLQPAVIFFVAVVFVVLSTRQDGQPVLDNLMIYVLAPLTFLVWLASTLLIVYTRVPLTYTKKTFDVLTNADPWLGLTMPAFALATFPIDVFDAVIAWRRRARGAHSRTGGALPARDRNSD